MDPLEIFFESATLGIALGAAVFAYFRFFREGQHHQRIQFESDAEYLYEASNGHVVEFGFTATNCGHVEQRFKDIRVTVRTLSRSDAPAELASYPPRLAFPHEVVRRASLVPEKYGYFFVRSGVTQRFPLVVLVPSDTAAVLVRATFVYPRPLPGGEPDIHSTERAFSLEKLVRDGGADEG